MTVSVREAVVKIKDKDAAIMGRVLPGALALASGRKRIANAETNLTNV